ncbi:uncharacterized protein LOC101853007 [Aplysia californica]|uniref:Uncharacterized protein LOC101853007 n=1 Tax=Aplysia californica TaxID=6500 RepID=A0ABM0JSY3_APLCA|nr:uncharacterized protein LOC101853007 [Aplysia californica]
MRATTKTNLALLCLACASLFGMGYVSRYRASTNVDLSGIQKIQQATISPPLVTVFKKENPRCVDLLSAVQNGYWVSRTPPKRELIEIQSFLDDVRIGYFKLPPTLQRDDGHCGNVNFKGRMFRALCNPDGPTPCCFEFQCASKSVDQCRCSTCFDLRREMHADFGSYVLKDPACKMTTFKSKADLCSMLENVSISFIGDSFVRQIYISVLAMLRHGKIGNVVKNNTSMSERERCREQRIYIAGCRHLVDREVTECDQTVKLNDYNYFKTQKANLIMEVVKGLVGKRHSILYIGLGIHDGLNSTTVHEKVVKPMMRIVGKNQWPKIVWSTPHVPGLLKSPFHKNQDRSAVLAFIKDMKRILKGYNIPVMDTYHLTNGVVSYDGLHYAKGINDIKAQILLNLVQRLRNNGWSTLH